jgi:hypothetical protein
LDKHSKQLFALILIVLTIALVGDFVSGAIGIASSGGGGAASAANPYPFGTWFNFPSSTQCTANNFSDPSCETFGNTTYRIAPTFNGAESNVEASIEVGCKAPSNTIGATLLLQYANYSFTTQTNSSNFITIHTGNSVQSVLIDNSVGNPCPGVLATNFYVPMPVNSSSSSGWMFRVVGINGGGVGDNPRFSFIGVQLQQYIRVAPNLVVTFCNNNHCNLAFQTTQNLVTSLTATFNWDAVNVTANTLCGAGLLCEQFGSGSCTIAIGQSICSATVNFATPFLITSTVTMTASPRIASAPVFAEAPTFYPLFITEPVTR